MGSLNLVENPNPSPPGSVVEHTGRFLDDSGMPRSGVEVDLYVQNVRVAYGFTDSNGNYKIPYRYPMSAAYTVYTFAFPSFDREPSVSPIQSMIVVPVYAKVVSVNPLAVGISEVAYTFVRMLGQLTGLPYPDSPTVQAKQQVQKDITRLRTFQ